MKLTNYYLKIAELISMEITGDLGPEEKDELSRWLGSSIENVELYHKLRKDLMVQFGQTTTLDIDKEQIWNNIDGVISKDKGKSKYSFFLKYAAVMTLVFLLSGLAYLSYYNNTMNSDQLEVKLELNPGEQKALLVMSDGSTIHLDENKRSTIKEKDGSLINNDENSLAYERATDVDKPKRQNTKALYNTLIAPRGGEYNITLSDGTKVWINADSKFKYPVYFNKDIREVELEGEAYFEVEHMNDKPFIIKTTDYNIEVLGTSFNVLAYEDDHQVITTLVKGSIKIKGFDDSGNELLVKPNEQVLLDKMEKEILVRNVDVNAYTAWKEGRFMFVKQDLERILKVLSRWYNFEVAFESEELKTIRFTGNMDRYELLATALEMIAETNKVDFIINNKRVLVTKRN